MKHVLVTGASGFLGKYIVDELLTAGFAVRALVRNPENIALPSAVTVIKGDVLDIHSLEDAIEGAHYVVHAAAVVTYQKKRFPEMKEINAKGTANVVNICLDKKIEKLVFVSSIAAIGRTEEQTLIIEQTKWKESPLNTTYAVSKRLADLEVWRGVEEGLNAVMVNPGVIIGAGNWSQGTPQLFSMIAKGMKFYNNGVNGYVGAKDVARAIRLLLEENTVSGDRFILVNKNLSQKELFTLMANALKVSPPTLRFPPVLAPLAGTAFDILSSVSGKEFLVSSETMRNAVRDFRYDGNKITHIGNFSYTPIETVIEETATAYLSS